MTSYYTPTLGGGLSITVGDRTHVTGSTGTSPQIVNWGSGSAEIGCDCQVGSVVSAGTVLLKDRCTVSGDVLAAGVVDRVGSTVVTGTVTANGMVALPPAPGITSQWPTSNQGDVTVNYGQTQTLSPGSWGIVTINSGGTLVLLPGTYFFSSFTLYWDGVVRLSGQTTVEVRDSLGIQGLFQDANSQQMPVALRYRGTAAASIVRSYYGTVLAPNAQLSFGGQGAITVRGQFFAHQLVLQPDSVTVNAEVPPDGGLFWNVHGSVQRAGVAVTSGTVKAYDITNGSEVQLGTAALGADGIYSISYAPAAFQNNGSPHQSPNLKIRIYDTSDHLVGESSLVSSATSNHAIDVVIWTVHGAVRQGGGPVTSGTVKAFDVTNGSEVQLGTATLGGDGTYAIDYAPSAFQNNGSPHQSPNLKIRVYDTSSNAVGEAALVASATANQTIDVSLWNVHGAVLRVGAPVTSGTVKAFDVTNGYEAQLGSATLGAGGTYSIDYAPSAFQNNGSPHNLPNLKIRVYGASDALVGESPLFASAAASQTIDVAIRNVHGTVQRMGAPVTSGTVKAFDITNGNEAQLGTAALDAGGTYSIDYLLSAYESNGGSHESPNLKVRVYNTSGTLVGEAPLVAAASSSEAVNVVIWNVHGTVQDAGVPVTSGMVKAFDITNGHEVVLGTATLGAGGTYSIDYLASAFETNGSAHSLPNLKVRVYDASDRVVAESPLLASASSNQTINLALWNVQGTVQRAGAPVTLGMVKAYDVTDGREALLGTATLGAGGTYSIDYSPADFQNNGTPHDAPNVLVRVYSEAGDLIGDAALVTRAASMQTINVTIWVVHGTVQHAGVPLTSGRVKVFDDTEGRQVVLGSATLRAGGTYSIDYFLSSFRNNGTTHDQPNLIARAYDKTGAILNESQRVSPASTDQLIDLIMGERHVFGVIRNKLELPVAQVAVDAYQVAWTTSGLSEILLGSGTSDDAGRYSIYYSPPNVGAPSPCSPPVGQINLIVYAKQRDDGGDVILAKNGVILDAPVETEANLLVDLPSASADSEYGRVMTRLSPCFAGSGDELISALTQLKERPEYLSFVAKTTEQEEALVRAYVLARLIATEIDEKANTAALIGHPLDPEVVYALVRSGRGTTLSELLDIDPPHLFSAIVDAIHKRTIGAAWEKKLYPDANDVSLLTEWRKILAELLNREGGGDEETKWQQPLLAMVFSDGLKRRRVVETHFDHPDSLDALCEALAEPVEGQPSFDAGDVENLRFALELYEKAGYFFPLVQVVYAHKSTRGWDAIEDLVYVPLENVGAAADADVDDIPAENWGWVAYADAAAAANDYVFPADIPGRVAFTEADRSGHSKDWEAKVRTYAARLFELFGVAQADVRFSSDLQEYTEIVGGQETHPFQATGEFLDAHPDFDLETTVIDRYVADLENRDELPISQLKQVQRVYRLTSSFETANALIKAGLDSAVKIAQLDEGQFIADYEDKVGGLTAARNIHRAAKHYASQVMLTLAAYHQSLNETGTGSALPNGVNLMALAAAVQGTYNPGLVTTTGTEDTGRFPNWITLFGDLNKCTCKECQTILSPGAYLVDLLEFIDGAPKKTLFERRPDLADIEVTCPNTNKMVPYIDLVNEVLEAVVAPLMFELVISDGYRNTIMILDSAARPEDNLLCEADSKRVRDAFAARGYVLGSQALLKFSALDGDDDFHREWFIEEDSWRFPIRSARDNAGVPRVYVYPAPQTSATNDSLETFPEHFNPGAYAILKQSVFPFNLPFDIGKEETEIFLKLKKVPRYEILEAFEAPAVEDPETTIPAKKRAPDLYVKLMSDRSAKGYLGLSWAEWDAILEGGPECESWTYWGFEQGGVEAPVSIPRPDKPTLTITASSAAGEPAPWIKLLSMVPVFLHRSGLTYSQLVELLDTEFVHISDESTTEEKITIVAADDDVQECNYNEFQISGLNQGRLDRIRSFLRLWRKVGWTMRELDRFVMALDADGSLDGNDAADPEAPPRFVNEMTLTMLHQVKRLCDHLQVAPLTALSWWHDIDVRRTRLTPKSLFDEVFLIGDPKQDEGSAGAQPSVYLQLDSLVPRPGQSIAPIDVDTDDDSVNRYLSLLRAALGLTPADGRRLWDLTVPTNPDNEDRFYLELDTLSQMYRIATFSSALGLTVSEYFEICAAFDYDPDPSSDQSVFQSASMTHAAVRDVARLKQSGIKANEIAYLLHDKHTPADRFVPGDREFDGVLCRVAGAAAQIAAANPIGAADAEGIAKLLEKLIPAERIAQVFETIEGPATPPPAEGAPDRDAYQADLDARRGFLEWYCADFFPAEFREEITTYQANDAARTARYALVWQRLHEYLIGRALESAALTTCSETAGLDEDVTKLLLKSCLTSAAGGAPAAEELKECHGGGWLVGRGALANAGAGTWRAKLNPDNDSVSAFVVTVTQGAGFVGTELSLKVDGIDLSPSSPSSGADTTTVEFGVSLTNNTDHEVVLTYTGSHTVSLQWKVGTGSATSIPADKVRKGGGWRSTQFIERTIESCAPGIRYGHLVIPHDGTFQLVVDSSDQSLAVLFDGSQLEEVTAPAGVSVAGRRFYRAQSLKGGSVHEVVVVGSATLLWAVNQAAAVVVPASVVVPLELAAYLKLFKAARMVKGLGVTRDELGYLLSSEATDFSLDDLPVRINDASVPWVRLSGIIALLALNRSVALTAGTLFDLWLRAEANDATLPAVSAETIATYSGWRAADVNVVLGVLGSSQLDWKNPELWYTLQACMSIVRRLDLPASQIRTHLAPQSIYDDPGIVAANALRDLYRSRFSKKEWKDALKPPRDALRQRQRDALTGYLCSRPITCGGEVLHFFDSDDLYAHFLIDVQMEADTLISRIKLALNAIQLFVNRVFLGLEDVDSLTELKKAKDEWSWMESYRLWEANRRVFLYPENWIEPELRDDKTEAFEELEQELTKNELTLETAKAAVAGYLEKMHEVSHLEVVGAYKHEKFSGGTNYDLHVVGRTHSQPHEYYHRIFEAKQLYDGKWTPWRKIGLDITADTVAPVVFNGRVYLVWPMVVLKQKSDPRPGEEVTQSNAGKLAADDKSFFWAEVRLMRSEFSATKNAWSKPTVSKNVAIDITVAKPADEDSGSGTVPLGGYHLRVTEATDDFLSIDILKTTTPTESNSDLTVFRLGAFKVWFDGHDSFEPSAIAGVSPESIQEIRSRMSTRYKAKLDQPLLEQLATVQDLRSASDKTQRAIVELGSNWPIGTMIKAGAAEEVRFGVENTYSEDKLTFKGRETFFDGTAGSFRVFEPNFGYVDDKPQPFFFSLENVSLFALDKGVIAQPGLNNTQLQLVAFQRFNHPVVSELQARLRQYGLEGLMNRGTEALPSGLNRYLANYYYDYYGSLLLGYHLAGDWMASGSIDRQFEAEYFPHASSVLAPYPLPTVDFSFGSSFGAYNWELFFHLPVLIATRLSQEMKYEDAMKWFHFIFDPKQELSEYERTSPWAGTLKPWCRYWNFLPFFSNKDATKRLLDTMGLGTTPPTDLERQELAAVVDEWRRQPFNPHLIARHRIVAYQKAVVMKYLDNLIAWADQLFRQDTWESLNQATQLYVLAGQLLGDRPDLVEPLTKEPKLTYRELKAMMLDSFSNVLVDSENLLVTAQSYLKDQVKTDALSAPPDVVAKMTTKSAYFRIPRNDRLDAYWDKVEDRLFKIRNSMNIDGVKRQLALFEPPIDPALLVRGAALGMSAGDILKQLTSALPCYRFAVWQQKAVELCNEVRGFGSALLSALEKRDAEELQLLRQGHEITMLQLVRSVRQEQLREAERNIEALEQSKAIAAARHEEYRNRERVSGKEAAQLLFTNIAGALDLKQGGAHTMASVLSALPDPTGGAVGFLVAVLSQFTGGKKLSDAANAAGSALGTLANQARMVANNLGTLASWDRRWEEWKFLERQAKLEMDQFDKQLLVAEIRRDIAEKELANHEKQMEHADEVRDFLKGKFSNQELYRWMAEQLTGTYQQVFRLAYEVARTAERSYQFELGADDAWFIQSSYMGTLHQGLLAGDKLMYDLKRMDIAYHERNRREFEIQKPISLSILNGGALTQLRETGTCDFAIPELLFDLDFPGQYFRRIKAVRLTIPCVTGPHTSVSAKLTLLSNTTRKRTGGGTYAYQGPGSDDRFVDDLTRKESISTSSAQNDAGLFELSFRDERYLPFENAGVISRWRLELPAAARQFDYGTISDVVMHLSYTARDGGETLKQDATVAIDTQLNDMLDAVSSPGDGAGLVRVFSLKREFPDVLHALLTKPNQNVPMKLMPEHFPFVLRHLDRDMTLVDASGAPYANLEIRVELKTGVTLPDAYAGDWKFGVNLPLPQAGQPPATGMTGLTDDQLSPVVVKCDLRKGGGATEPPGATPLLAAWSTETWQLRQLGLTVDSVEDVCLVVKYTV